MMPVARHLTVLVSTTPEVILKERPGPDIVVLAASPDEVTTIVVEHRDRLASRTSSVPLIAGSRCLQDSVQQSASARNAEQIHVASRRTETAQSGCEQSLWYGGHVVEGGNAVVVDAMARSNWNAGRNVTNGAGDWCHDHVVEHGYRFIAEHDKDRPVLVVRPFKQPKLAFGLQSLGFRHRDSLRQSKSIVVS